MQAIVVTVSNNYIPALKVLQNTIIRNTSKKFDFLAIEEEKITVKNKQLCNNVLFIDEPAMPKFCGRAVRKWNINPLVRYNIFRLKNYEKIIFLDLDMICLSNINELFDLQCDFGAVYHPHPDGVNSKNLNYSGFCPDKSFNAGLMVIGKKYLNDSVVEELLKISSINNWLGNQGPLNAFFNDKVTMLPENYFLSTPFINKKNIHTDIKFLHFGGDKKPFLVNSDKIKDNFSSFVLSSVLKNNGPSGYNILLKFLKQYKDELSKL